MEGDLKTDKELALMLMKATGAVKDDGLEGQVESIRQLIKSLEMVLVDVEDRLRIQEAQQTVDQRLTKDDFAWGTHMTHCYDWDYEGADYPNQPTHKLRCKYGEDDICPAALYRNPYRTYLDTLKPEKG